MQAQPAQPAPSLAAPSPDVHVLDVLPGRVPCLMRVLPALQNSTSLWEMLPTSVMDEAMRLHDECLRLHLGKYQGYESASEGEPEVSWSGLP